MKVKRNMFGADRIVDLPLYAHEADRIICRATGDNLHYMIVKAESHGGYRVIFEYTTKESVEFRI